MNRTLALLAALAVAAVPALAQAPQKVAADKSFIRFVSKQMNVPVEGRFKKFDASVTFDPKKPEATKAEFEVDLASIDMGSPEGETEAVRPLWFNTAQFPKAKFVASSVKSTGANKFEATGPLTIKGVTQNITTPFTMTEAAGMRTVEGQFTMKRLQFKIGEKQWADVDTVADEVVVRYKFVLPV
ncbi:YceI family protein [Usitatibacter palustris]|uniref:Protein YceI n=1 Tax=Usitatibacter palustris TaxID=2732487 RepID=A0A6M4HAS8_9PROT|nr:YceI family protein [Usitatibacter palustris]QJR15147.1 Protein YceI [Usitatibacter palustris]